MKRNHLFTNMASGILSFAVMVMSLALITCSNDDKEEHQILQPKPNTTILDGVDKPVLQAVCQDEGNGDYSLFLTLSADGREKMELQLNKELHMRGRDIKLTKREEKNIGQYYWSVTYTNSNNQPIFETLSDPDELSAPLDPPKPVFISGTLTVTGTPDSTICIVLKNGRVAGFDNKEHSITLNYKGKMKKR